MSPAGRTSSRFTTRSASRITKRPGSQEGSAALTDPIKDAIRDLHDAQGLITDGPARALSPAEASARVRTFETGANRDTDEGKFDFEGFLSTLSLSRFAEYMHKNRRLRDGSLRDADNWQKGIPRNVYTKSLWRHFFDAWRIWRKAIKLGRSGVTSAVLDGELEEALCGVLFNAMGLLHSLLEDRDYEATTHG